MFGAPRVHRSRWAGSAQQGHAAQLGSREACPAVICHAKSPIAHLEGEWSGNSASFSVHGKSLSLPEIHVPREYREWGIDLKDWSSLTSVTTTDGDNTVSIQTRFMLPTVGCEADATSFVEDKREFAVTNMGAEAATSSGSGSSGPVSSGVLQCGQVSYAAGPAELPATGKVMIECGVMVAPGRRVRLRVPMRKWNEEAAWAAEKLEVVSEEYSGPYKGGRELPMSCGAECGFSGDAAVSEEDARAAQVAADAVETEHGWLGDMLRGQDFVRMPCGCAARLSSESDCIGLQLAIMNSDESSEKLSSDAREALGDGKVAIVSIGISSAHSFMSQEDVLVLTQLASQAAEL